MQITKLVVSITPDMFMARDVPIFRAKVEVQVDGEIAVIREAIPEDDMVSRFDYFMDRAKREMHRLIAES